MGHPSLHAAERRRAGIRGNTSRNVEAFLFNHDRRLLGMPGSIIFFLGMTKNRVIFITGVATGLGFVADIAMLAFG